MDAALPSQSCLVDRPIAAGMKLIRQLPGDGISRLYLEGRMDVAGYANADSGDGEATVVQLCW